MPHGQRLQLHHLQARGLLAEHGGAAMSRSRTKTSHIVKAWTDPRYRASLSAEERRQIPPNPAGETADENGLEAALGGFTFGSGCGTVGCFTLCPTGSCTCTCSCTCCCPSYASSVSLPC
jgi:mersacidin/lichenicidin family type 2 lantibiotic